MYLTVILLILIIPAIASGFVSMTYRNLRDYPNDSKKTGFEVARKILDANGLKDMYVVETKGTMTDHYDPSQKVIRLSSEVYHGATIAATAIAAHECGHALQDKEGYLYMRLRTFIFPMVNFATGVSYFIIFLGFLLSSLDLVWLGIGCVGTGLVFQIVTLPVEINASLRAKKQLKALNLEQEEEEKNINQMLISAASTYVAGVLASALELVRLIFLFTNDRN